MPTSFQEIALEAQRRWQALVSGDCPWIRVGTALCGNAAGAQDSVEAINASVQQHGASAKVSEVGCIGLCYAEPLVDVQLPGGPRVFYGNVTTEMAEEIVASHVVGRQPVANLALGYLGRTGGRDSGP